MEITGGELIYVIGEENTPFVKIGRTAGDVYERIAGGLQTGNPRKLYPLLTMPCDDSAGVESRLHAEFSPFRRVGEWFEVAGDFDWWFHHRGAPVPACAKCNPGWLIQGPHLHADPEIFAGS